MFNKSN